MGTTNSKILAAENLPGQMTPMRQGGLAGWRTSRRGPGIFFYLMMAQLGSQIVRQQDKQPVTLTLLALQVLVHVRPAFFLAYIGLRGVRSKKYGEVYRHYN